MNRLASPRSRLLVLVLVAALPAFALTLYTRLEHRRAAGSPGSRPPSKTTCSRTRAGSHLPSPSCLRSGHSNPGRWNHLPINDAGEWGRFLRTVERQLAQRSQPFLSPLSRGPCSSSTTMMRCVPSSVSTSASKAFTYWRRRTGLRRSSRSNTSAPRRSSWLKELFSCVFYRVALLRGYRPATI